MPRSRLGPLAIESKLGEASGSSSVWRAVHLKQRKSAAVKVFSQPFGGTPEGRQRLTEEWTELKQIRHSSIARCFGGGFEQRDAYLVYELVDGESLATQLRRRGRQSWETVLEIAEPLIEALEYLHGRGIKYGHLVPDKIVIAGLSPVLVDVRLNRDGPYQSNRPPSVAELALQPPELLSAPGQFTVQSDLYMFGAVLYLALTGTPPIDGGTIEEVSGNLRFQTPVSPATTVMDCPVWLDKLIGQLLSKEPSQRPVSATAVRMALAEVRRRAMSRTGVAEHASSGFSPLAVTDQRDRDEARVLLGRELVDLDEETYVEASAWYEKTAFLLTGLMLAVGLIVYLAWPLSEQAMRQRSEAMLESEVRSTMVEARSLYLRPMIQRFPDGQHAQWAAEQIERVNMIEAEHALGVKLKRGLPLKNEAERLIAEALEYEKFGDRATALEKYHSMVTILGDDDQYLPLVNLARNKIAKFNNGAVDTSEAARIVQTKLLEARRLAAAGNVAAAESIWRSVIDLYANNADVAPLVQRAQDALSERRLSTKPTSPATSTKP